MIYKHKLPVIEVKEIEEKPKTQWELQLEKQLHRQGKESAFCKTIKPSEKQNKFIEWF